MTGRDDDEAWRSIVENYGERARLDDPDPQAAGPDEAGTAPARPAEPAPGRFLGREPLAGPAAGPVEGPGERAQYDEPDADRVDRFVPPPAPPLPRPTGLRGAAWVALLGVPPLLLVCLLAGVALPRALSGLLGLAAVAGFGYLVLTMPRGPRDPWDDGSRV